jgi:hypothetical protein
MSCKCNACKDPFTLPRGEKGAKGDPGGRGATGKDGVCTVTCGGMIYSNYGPQGLAAPTETTYSNYSYNVLAGTLSEDGDTLVVNALWSKYTTAGTGSVFFFFNGNKVSFDYGSAGGESGESTLKFEITITRVSNTEAVVVAKSTEYGASTPSPLVGGDISVGANVTGSFGSNVNLQFLKRTTISSLNLDTTSYVIEPKNISSGTSSLQYLEYMTIEQINKV